MTSISIPGLPRVRGRKCLHALALLGASVGSMTIAASPVAAQDYTTGAIIGTVVTSDGSRVSGGTATVVSNAQGFSRTATIGVDGVFRISALPIGTYSVTVAASGFQSVQDSNVGIAAGTTNSFTFTVAAPAGSAGDADIVVQGTAVRGNDFGTNTGGLTINDVGKLLNRLPIPRNQTALILLAPGTTAGDTTLGDGNLASLSGATVAENQYYVNGLNVTNFRKFVGSQNPPIEFYQSFDVKTFGLSAEYGRALGGFTTTVTKAGSNTFKAGAIIAYSPDGLTSDAPDTYAAYNRTDYVEDVESNFNISGPIIKDRLFFYALYNPNYYKEQNSSITDGQRLSETDKSTFFGGKLDAVIADGHRLEGTYFRNASKNVTRYDAFDGATGAIGGYIGSLVETAGGDNFVGTYTGQFAKWLTLSASYGENHDNQSYVSSPQQSSILSNLTGTETTARGFVRLNSEDEDVRRFYRADGDIYVSLLGNHHFRFGYEQEKLTSSTDTQSVSGYRYLLTPNYIYRYKYSNVGTWKSKNEAYYLQDNWSMMSDRLNLQLGLRNDRFSNDALDGTTYFESGDQWGPRLGASFDVFGDKRTTLRGSWSRYFLPVATNTNIRLGGAELSYRQRFAYPAGSSSATSDSNGLATGLTYDAQGNILGLTTNTGSVAGECPAGPDAGEPCSAIYSDGIQGPTDTLVSSNLQPSYTDEWTIGAQQRLGDWTFSLTYINRRLGETLDDVAVDAAVLKYCEREGIVGCADTWDGFHQYVLANPGSDITVRLDGDCTVDKRQCEVATLTAGDLGYSKASRNYDSVQFQFQKAETNNWFASGSYTYTKLRGNYEGAVKSDNGQEDAGLTQDFDQPGLSDGSYGTLANQREHAFKLFGSYAVTPSFRIGMNLIVESPRKFSCIGGHYDSANFAYAYDSASYYCSRAQSGGQAYVDPEDSTRTSYLVKRGTAFESDWNKQVDVNAQFDLTALPGSFISIDVRNVFNFQSKLDFDEYGDNDGGTANDKYQEVLGYQSPRSVRFTFGIRLGEPSSGE